MANGIKNGNVNDEATKDTTTNVSNNIVTVHVAPLEKGTYVKLRPLEAGYDPEDWKALLEQHLRSNFTTLTKGEVLGVPTGQVIGGQPEYFQFLVDQLVPDNEAICVIDTELTCDVEALNEEQARETLRRIAEKRFKAPATTQGSSPGGKLDLFRGQDGQVLPGEYVDYQLPSWNRSQGIEF